MLEEREFYGFYNVILRNRLFSFRPLGCRNKKISFFFDLRKRQFSTTLKELFSMASNISIGDFSNEIGIALILHSNKILHLHSIVTTTAASNLNERTNLHDFFPRCMNERNCKRNISPSNNKTKKNSMNNFLLMN